MNRRTLLKLSGALVVGSALGAADALQAAAPVKGKPGPATRPARKEQLVKVSVYNAKGELVGPIEEPKVVKTDEEWRLQLTADQFKIARAKGTERPFCGNLLDNHREGVYTCVCCGLPLFSSDSKFNSGTGWPSFFQPITKENVVEHIDRSHGMVRKESLCARCDCHLGHVFDDGPKPTGLRFCMNSESLKFTDKDKLATLADPAAEKLAGATTQPAKG